jgi:hypothetical protein
MVTHVEEKYVDQWMVHTHVDGEEEEEDKTWMVQPQVERKAHDYFWMM